MKNQSGHASATLALFSNATNLRPFFVGTLAVTALFCGVESLSSQESKLQVNQGSGLRGVEPAARNSVPNPRRWLPLDVDETLPPIDTDRPCLLQQSVDCRGSAGQGIGDESPAVRELRWELFAKLDNTGPTNVALRVKPGATNPTAQLRGSSTPMAASRFEAAHVSSAESHRTQHLPPLYQEDTPFSTEVRMPVADLWGGRLQFDGFCREISANSMVHGLPQSGGIWWATPQSLTLRPATSYGIQLSFRMPHIRPRTLYRYLLGRGG